MEKPAVILATSQQEFSDADWRAVATGDQSKKLKLLLSGLTTATTRVWTASDKDGTVLLSSDLAANVLTFLGTPSSANLAAALTDETGTAGQLPFAQFGSWTPSLGGTTTYTVRTARYIKLGIWVWAAGRVLVNAIGTGSTTTMTGLPFTSGSNTDLYAGSVGKFSGLTTSVTPPSPVAAASGTSIVFYSQTAAATSNVTNAIFGSGSDISFTVVYEAT